jgi:hypothetical protein
MLGLYLSVEADAATLAEVLGRPNWVPNPEGVGLAQIVNPTTPEEFVRAHVESLLAGHVKHRARVFQGPSSIPVAPAVTVSVL